MSDLTQTAAACIAAPPPPPGWLRVNRVLQYFKFARWLGTLEYLPVQYKAALLRDGAAHFNLKAAPDLIIKPDGRQVVVSQGGERCFVVMPDGAVLYGKYDAWTKEAVAAETLTS